MALAILPQALLIHSLVPSVTATKGRREGRGGNREGERGGEKGEGKERRGGGSL